MDIKKIIGLLLIVVSIGIGYLGVNKISNSSTSVEVLDVKLGVSDKSEKQLGYMYVGFAVLVFVGGIYTLKKKN